MIKQPVLCLTFKYLLHFLKLVQNHDQYDIVLYRGVRRSIHFIYCNKGLLNFFFKCSILHFHPLVIPAF